MGKYTEQNRGTQPPCANCENLKAKLAEVQEQYDTYRTDQHDSMADRLDAEQRAEKAEARAKTLENALVLLALPHEALLMDKESRKWIAPEIWQAIESGIDAARNVLGITPTPKSVQKRLEVQRGYKRQSTEVAFSGTKNGVYEPADPCQSCSVDGLSAGKVKCEDVCPHGCYPAKPELTEEEMSLLTEAIKKGGCVTVDRRYECPGHFALCTKGYFINQPFPDRDAFIITPAGRAALKEAEG